MSSTTISPPAAQAPKSLENAASPLSLLIVVAGQIYLFWLVATSRSTFSQAMLMTCVESLFAWLLTTIFFSRTWRGVLIRCRELLIMTVVLVMFMIVFGFLETTWGGDQDLSNWFAEMRFMWSMGRFHYALVYLAIFAGGWLLMAWRSGQPRNWWAANVAAPASVTFAAMFMACAAGWILVFVPGVLEDGLSKIGLDARHFVQLLRGIAPMLLVIVYSATRIFLGWKMATMFTAEDWRKAEAKLYFDAV